MAFELPADRAQQLHHDAVVVDCHNDLILLVDWFDGKQQPDHFASYWLPELRRGGVDVQILPIYIEERFQSEGAVRRTLLGLGPDFIDDYYQEVYGGWVLPPDLGSADMPRADISWPSDLPMLTEALLRRGFEEPAIGKVLGLNVLRVLDQVMGVPEA